MQIFIPAETAEGERRVAGVPDSVVRFVKLGHNVVVESGAGEPCGFTDEAYREAGAAIVSDAAEAWSAAGAVLKVRAPTDDEIKRLPKGCLLACYLQPALSDELLRKLADAGVTSLALDAVPRTSRAQSMDTLSAMANIAGYRAVIEAAAAFGRFFSGQMTAAGRLPPAKVLVIGAGVAGLSAVGAAKNLGAIVRAFDTRAATKDQVESLGGEFLTIHMEESGEGAGGYAKEMSQAFLDAEYALFREQADEVEDVLTLAVTDRLRGGVEIDQLDPEADAAPPDERIPVVEVAVVLALRVDLDQAGRDSMDQVHRLERVEAATALALDEILEQLALDELGDEEGDLAVAMAQRFGVVVARDDRAFGQALDLLGVALERSIVAVAVRVEDLGGAGDTGPQLADAVGLAFPASTEEGLDPVAPGEHAPGRKLEGVDPS